MNPTEIKPSPAVRREILLSRMGEHAAEAHSCSACSGLCCTFLANSMRITPLEALDIRDALMAEQRWNEDLMETLRENVRRFRLDIDSGDGRRSLRKTYTCPFFSGNRLGCTLPATHKPYGCLAFNPRRSGQTEGGDCASEQDLLQQRENAFPDESAQILPYLWDKAPIPLALLHLHNPTD